jgi:hypothetical protein
MTASNLRKLASVLIVGSWLLEFLNLNLLSPVGNPLGEDDGIFEFASSATASPP